MDQLVTLFIGTLLDWSRALGFTTSDWYLGLMINKELLSGADIIG